MNYKILFNIILYAILTIFLIYMLKKENIIYKKIDLFKIFFSEKISEFLAISTDRNKKITLKIIYIFEIFFISLFLIAIIKTFYIGNFIVPSTSMEPIIEKEDRFFGNMMIYRFRKPKLEEIIIFIDPVTNKKLYVKRIIGLPGEIIKTGESTLVVPKIGDTIKIIPGYNYQKLMNVANLNKKNFKKYLLKNLNKLDKILPNLKFTINDKETGQMLNLIYNQDILENLLEGKTVELVLKEDYYYVLGDNLNESVDSRTWGFINEKSIKGKPILRFFPINKIGKLK